VWFQFAGHEPQKRRLAGPVRANEGDDGAFAHPEGDVTEQRSTIRQVVVDVCNLDMTHVKDSSR
jgi:hypothetical protein